MRSFALLALVAVGGLWFADEASARPGHGGGFHGGHMGGIHHNMGFSRPGGFYGGGFSNWGYSGAYYPRVRYYSYPSSYYYSYPGSYYYSSPSYYSGYPYSLRGWYRY